IRGPAQGVRGGGCRMAVRRMFDVSWHEPRHVAAGPAIGVHIEPQLRRAAGAGWPYAFGLATRFRGNSGRRSLCRPGRSELTTRSQRGVTTMQKFTVHTGTVLPLRRSDVDTDQIIPAVYLKRITKTGFADGLFRAWRDTDPAFPLESPAFAGATILVAGP